MCTIIAKNYLAFARTLCQSFLEHHPSGECYVLVIDEWRGWIDPEKECFKLVSMQDLDIPNLSSFCFQYKLIELSTAVKPYLIDYLLTHKSLSKILYFDPDIWVTRPLTEVYEALAADDIFVTPHLDSDFPDDGTRPDDADIMSTGIFNLGFIGVRASETAYKFIAWWKGKLYNRCLDAAGEGYFLDQKFIDLALSFFANIHVEKGIGYNVAYWNIHSRKLGYQDGEWKVNDEPMYFFHFSGFRPDKPERISKHLTRFTMADRPDLRPLFQAYSERLYANGYTETRRWPYTFATFKSGRPITNGFRRYYMNMPDKWADYGNPFESVELEKLLAKFMRFRWPLQLLYDYFQIYRIEERVRMFK